MAGKHLVVGIEWYGPYSLEAAHQAAYLYGKGGLYLCIGKQKGEHRLRPQYVGKSNGKLYSRLIPNHHKLRLITRERILWVGVVATGNVPGRKKLSTPQAVRLAEWAIARFMNLPLNDRLRDRLPPAPVTVLNRWWSTDLETPRYHRPHTAWPDLIDFLGDEYRARVIWFGGHQRTIRPAEL